MRYWIFGLMGFAIGLPLGSLLLLTLQRFRKSRCIAGVEHGEQCNGTASKICLDGLCPTHCRVLHQDQCRTRHLAAAGNTP